MSIFSKFSKFFEILISQFFTFFLEMEGSHLYRKVRANFSCIKKCLPSLFLLGVPSYHEKTVLLKLIIYNFRRTYVWATDRNQKIGKGKNGFQNYDLTTLFLNFALQTPDFVILELKFGFYAKNHR